VIPKVIAGRGRPLSPVVTGLLLAAAVAAAYLVFRLFGVSYFHWYLEQGPLIALVVAGVAVAVELDRLPNLISAHPSRFLGACFEMAGESTLSLPEPVRGRRERDPDSSPFDGFFTFLFEVVYLGLVVAWLTVVAPLQYFVNLVTGAPARYALASPRRTWIERGKETTTITRGPFEAVPEGAEQIGLARRPVSLTSTITAGLLFGVSQLV
jgi:hypothetical protein